MTSTPRPAFHDPVSPPPAGSPWTVLRLLRWSTQYLAEKGIDDGRLDVENLLAHALDTTRLELYLEFERPVTPDELQRFKPLLLERAGRKPLQYILGRAHFRELVLEVDPRVLIPRPETEELVEAVLARVREWGREGLSAVDVGTGSGAIALSLAREGPFGRVVGIDRSAAALEVARANRERLDESMREVVEFREGDLLDALESGEEFDVVVSNPPYVAAGEYEELAPEVREWEPMEALMASGDGLHVLRRLIREAPEFLRAEGLLALEVGAGQAHEVADAIRSQPGLGAPVTLRDLSGRDRIVMAHRTEGRDTPAGSTRRTNSRMRSEGTDE